MKEIIKKCNSYDKQVGCYHTSDGKCNKENCQTYNLLQENEKLKKENRELEIENVRLQNAYQQLAGATTKLGAVKQALEEIREKCTTYAKTESYIIDETFSEFLEIVFNKADEVLK